MKDDKNKKDSSVDKKIEKSLDRSDVENSPDNKINDTLDKNKSKKAANENNMKPIKVDKKDSDDKLDNQENKLNFLSVRPYLEQTVVPVLMQGLAELSKEKPENPLEFLGNYLIKRSKGK